MNWLKDCEICNVGLCKAVVERKEQGMSERAACRDMSEESEGLYSEDAIYSRYRYYTGKLKASVCESHTDDEILRAADAIKEKRLKEDLETTPGVQGLIEDFLQTDYYGFTLKGLEIRRPATKEEWLEYGSRLKLFMQMMDKSQPNNLLLDKPSMPEQWNYDASVKKTKSLLNRRRNLVKQAIEGETIQP